MEILPKDIIKLKWFKHLYVLYLFGFVVNFTPAHPFAYEYLVSYRNESATDTRIKLLPYSIYSTPIQTAVVFLLVDFCNFNVFITFSSVFGIIATSLSIWYGSFLQQQIAQVFYGSIAATEIAYYASIFSHSDVKDYNKVNAILRAAPLAGKLVSFYLAQLLITQQYLNYKELLYINLSFFILATFISVFLPKAEPQQKKVGIISNVLHSFPNKYVVKWSIWMALTFCGYNQTRIYIQPLWKILQDDSKIYNGLVEGTFAFFGLIAVGLAGFSNFDWKYTGDLILSLTSLIQSFALILTSQLESVFFNHFFYIIFGYMYHFVVTMLTAEIAKFLQKGTFGIVFGFILILGSTINSVMVYLVIEHFNFDSRQEFMVYGFYHFVISICFIAIGLGYWLAKHSYK